MARVEHKFLEGEGQPHTGALSTNQGVEWAAEESVVVMSLVNCATLNLKLSAACCSQLTWELESGVDRIGQWQRPRKQADVLVVDWQDAAEVKVALSKCAAGQYAPRVIAIASQLPATIWSDMARGDISAVACPNSDVSTLTQAIRSASAGGCFVAPNLLFRDRCRDQRSSPFANLSKRERVVLDRVVAGQTNSAIAVALRLSTKTIETYRARGMAKLGVTGVVALMKLAVQGETL